MARKRLTQVFPFLLPPRKWQRKKLFYYKMRKDGCRYAKR
ncbi:MAG: glycopeptide resistance accessory protein VanW, partial [Lachnospiraceae bacterium]|nr:glycopeptide resistance accessory protein VanW [Lachnospiraceae bacterium]